MMEPNFQGESQIRTFEHEGFGKYGITELESTKVEVLQRQVSWKLEERKEKIDRGLHALGISINENAIHERIEKIMGLSEDELDILEKRISAKLEEKKKELESLVKSH